MTTSGQLPLIRTSERGSFKRCRLQWKWAYLDKLRPVSLSPPLRFGRMVHEALEAYYVPGRERGPHPVKTFLELYDADLEKAQEDFGWGSRVGEDWLDAREMGEDMLTRYVDRWREEDKLWEVVAPEIPALVVVNSKRGKPMARYLMQFDAVIFHHERGLYYFVDHKTAASIPGEEEKALDEQCGAYWTFGPDYLRDEGHIPEDAIISGFIYNYLRKAVGDTRPQDEHGRYLNQPKKDDLNRAAEEHDIDDWNPRAKKDDMIEVLEAHGIDWEQYGEVSKSQPPDYFARFPVYRDEADRENVRFRVRGEIHDMNLARQGKIAIYKNPMFGGVFGCPQCPFYDPCQLHESGGDYEEMFKLAYEIGDPYEQYRDDLELEEF